MDWIRWISMTMSERILIMVKNKVVLKERDAWSDLANFIGEMVAKYAEAMDLDNLPDPEYKDADMDYEVTRSDIKILKQIHSLGDEQYKRLMAYMKALQKLEQMENMVEE